MHRRRSWPPPPEHRRTIPVAPSLLGAPPFRPRPCRSQGSRRAARRPCHSRQRQVGSRRREDKKENQSPSFFLPSSASSSPLLSFSSHQPSTPFQPLSPRSLHPSLSHTHTHSHHKKTSPQRHSSPANPPRAPPAQRPGLRGLQGARQHRHDHLGRGQAQPRPAVRAAPLRRADARARLPLPRRRRRPRRTELPVRVRHGRGADGPLVVRRGQAGPGARGEGAQRDGDRPRKGHPRDDREQRPDVPFFVQRSF